MKVTIKEIAEMAGVHRATVDKVLHNRIGVSDDVRKKIQAIIKQVDYVPNPVGRALQKQKDTFRIAAVLVDVDALPYLRHGIDAHIAERQGFDIQVDYFITKFQDIKGQASIIEKLITEKVSGIILSPINADLVRQAVDRAVASGIPVITTNSDLRESRRTCYVGMDAARGARIAGRLMGQFLGGRGNVAVITSSIASENNNYFVRIREQTFAAFLEQQYPNLQIIERVESLEDPQVTFEETKRLLLENPQLDGLYITCGGVAEVGRALVETGRTDSVKALCFEDYPDILELLRRGVIHCTLGSDIENQGRIPARILLDQLIFGAQPEQSKVFTDIKILVKECID